MVHVGTRTCLTSGMENGHGFCLRATGSPPFVTGPGSLSAGTECRVDGGRRRRGGGAVAVQSADVLSRWHFRVGRLCGALRGKLDHPPRRAGLSVESPSATRCSSFRACPFTPGPRSALCHPPGYWSACGSCGGLISARRDLG